MDKRKIAIGDYEVRQAENHHVAVIYAPEKRLVAHFQVGRRCSEEELKEFYNAYMEMNQENPRKGDAYGD